MDPRVVLTAFASVSRQRCSLLVARIHATPTDRLSSPSTAPGIKGFVNYNNYDRSSSAPYASSYVDYAGAEDTEPSSPANESPSWRSSSAPATSTSARRFATLLQAIEEARRLSASESDGYGSASGGREGVEASKVGEALRRMDAQLLERETCNLKQYVIKAAQSGIRVKWTNGAGSGGRIHTY